MMDHILGDILAVAPFGWYISPIKIIVMLVFLTPWLYLAPWVQKDAKDLHLSGGGWSLAIVFIGVLTVFVWIVQPFFVVGLLIYILLTGGMLIAYVVNRNSRVEEGDEKLLSISHISSLFGPKKVKEATVVNKLRLYHADSKIVLPPGPDAEDDFREAYNMAQELLYDIVWRRAGEADISPATAQARVRFVVDGVVMERPPMGLSNSEAVIQCLKRIGGMDVEDRRRPQQGKMAVDLAGMQIEMGLRCAGSTGGQRMQIRVFQEFVRTKLDTLNMPEDVLAKIREVNQAGAGLIIISGRPGSGVTSTLYSLLKEQDAYIKQLETLESKVAIDLENITQHVYGDPEQVHQQLSSVLRRDPNVIMIDQCPDAAAAELIANSASEKMMLLGMQAGDTFTALARWVRLCSGPALAMANLMAITCQMLVRKLCPNCREEYRPDPMSLAKLNLSARKIEFFYRPLTKPLTDEKGNPIACPTCQGSGYLGRTAVFELLEITDEIRKQVTEGSNLSQIKSTCRKSGMLYLQELALEKVIEGVTSIQEVIRVSSPSEKKQQQ